jgi:hypothetical protein
MNDFYASGKVSVGDSLCLKKEASRYWSDRVPEATGRGSYLIMPRIDRIQDIYMDMPFYEWGDWAGLENIIRVSLDGNIAEVQKKQQAITAEGHTYKNRVQTILNYFGIDNG